MTRIRLRDRGEKKKGEKGVIGFLIMGILIGSIIGMFAFRGLSGHEMNSMSMDEKRDTFISLKQNMQENLLPMGKYRCCLETPCMYCLEKDPKHGEGASCDCLRDIVNGIHPCGECIGEILEGHGNPYLKEYFAVAIAEKTGHLEAIQSIIDEKYGPIEEIVL